MVSEIESENTMIRGWQSGFRYPPNPNFDPLFRVSNLGFRIWGFEFEVSIPYLGFPLFGVSNRFSLVSANF